MDRTAIIASTQQLRTPKVCTPHGESGCRRSSGRVDSGAVARRLSGEAMRLR